MQNHETVTDLDENEDGTVVKAEDAMQMAWGVERFSFEANIIYIFFFFLGTEDRKRDEADWLMEQWLIRRLGAQGMVTRWHLLVL